jgi:hypothetical protein
MEQRDGLTKLLAVAGTALAWIPMLAPTAITAVFFLQTGLLRFDYLMPAELFLSALGGGCLLFWASLRAHSHQRFIGWSLAAAVAFLAGSQGSAMITGLASGATEPAGGPLALVILLLIGYLLAVFMIGVGGWLLLRIVFSGKGETPGGGEPSL